MTEPISTPHHTEEAQNEHEREIRALYRERNARTFVTPKHGIAHQGGLLLVMLFAVVVSGLVSLLVVTQWVPTTPLGPVQKFVRSATTTVEVPDDQLQHLSAAMVTVYQAKSSHSTGGISETVYPFTDAVSQGLVLSSDGWIVTTPLGSSSPRSFVVMTADGTTYPVSEILIDPVAPWWFLKVSASNLAVTAFADSSALGNTEQVVVMARASQLVAPAVYMRRLAQLAAPTFQGRGDFSVSSETIPDRYLLDQPLPFGIGAPVSTVKGEVVGLVVSYNGSLQGIVPLDNLNAVIDTIFAKHSVNRSLLGVNYVQSSWVGQAAVGGTGALVAAGGGQPAVLSKSPAAVAGLKAGDRIVAVGDERLAQRSLSALIQQYHPGTQTTLTFVRNGQEQTVNITLGQLVGQAKK